MRPLTVVFCALLVALSLTNCKVNNNATGDGSTANGYGYSGSGGGIYNGDTLRLSACDILSNSTGNGADAQQGVVSPTVQGLANALRSVVESASVYNKLYNSGFVLARYYGYLRRNPNAAPDNNFDGYNYWLSKLDQFTLPGEDARDEAVALSRVRRAEMVRAFLLSSEYRGRFQGDPNRGQ